MTTQQYIVRAMGQDMIVQSSLEAVKLCKRIAQKLPRDQHVLVFHPAATEPKEAAITLQGEL